MGSMRMLFLGIKKAVPVAFLVASCCLLSGCFIISEGYTYYALEKADSKPVRAATVEAAYIDADGVLTIAFSGWKNTHKMTKGSEKKYMVRVQTNPKAAASTAAHQVNDGKFIYHTFTKADVRRQAQPPPDVTPIPIYRAHGYGPCLSDVDGVIFRDNTFAAQKRGPGVWVSGNELKFLYLPPYELKETSLPVSSRSEAEEGFARPILAYTFPLVAPLMVLLDIITLPLKFLAIAIGILIFLSGDRRLF